jgi:hypothetical protein
MLPVHLTPAGVCAMVLLCEVVAIFGERVVVKTPAGEMYEVDKATCVKVAPK